MDHARFAGSNFRSSLSRSLAYLMLAFGCASVCTADVNIPLSTAGSPPWAIPDGAGANVFGPPLTLAGSISNSGYIAGISAVSIEMAHPFVADLRVRLVYTPADGPGAGVPVTVPILTRVGYTGSGNGDASDLDGSYVFTDPPAGQDGWAILTTLGNDTNFVLPSGSYAAFDALNAPVTLATSLAGLSATGTFELLFDDARSPATGTVSSASVTLMVECAQPEWSAQGSTPFSIVRALAVLSDGHIIAGGDNSAVGNIARYNPMADTWTALGSGVTGGVSSVAVLPDGDVIAGGTFPTAGGVAVGGLGRFDPPSFSWSAFGSGTDGASLALKVLPDGSVIVGGSFSTAGGLAANNIARYNPTTDTWSALGSGTNSYVEALAILSDGDVIAGGSFDVAGGVAVNNIARYDFTTGTWSALGSGVEGFPIGEILEMCALSDGSVVVGGYFDTAGGVPANYIARYHPTTDSWSAMGSGTNAIVHALVEMSDGDVIAGGAFTNAGGVAVNNIARYDAATGTWSALDSGTNNSVRALLVLPEGYVEVGGQFTTAGGLSVSKVARWFPGPADPSILLQPLSQTTALLGVSQFRVFALGGPGTDTPTYTWRKDGVPIDAMANPSAATAVLTIGSVQASDTGSYDCLVTNDCGGGGTLSDAATLSLVPDPCPGDYNGDGFFDLADLIGFSTDWQPNVGQNCP